MNNSVLRLGFVAISALWCSAAISQASVSLAQLQYVDFGVMATAPTRCSMSSNGLLSGSCVGTGIPGEIEVTGEPHYSYNVSVSSVGWVNDMTFRPALNAKRFSLDAQGRDVFTVTGELRFRGNFSQGGTFTLTYLISVDYQ